MKKYTFCFVVLAALAFASCTDKNAFILQGQVDNPKDIKKVYLIENDSTAVTIIDSAALSDQNKFSFKQHAAYAKLYSLKVGTNLYDLIAHDGDDITFKTNAADTTNAYEVTGSNNSEKIRDFNRINNHYTKITDQILNQYNYKTKTLGQAAAPALAEAMVLYKKNQAEKAEATLKFMHDNIASLASFYAATTLDPISYEKQLIDYSDEIRNKFPNNSPVQQFIKHMDAAKPMAVGHKAPDFTIMDSDNKPVKLSDYKGKYVMLDFWASWCGPCRQENPNVVKMYGLFKGKGLNILGISLDEKKEDWLKAIADDKLIWRQATEFKNFKSPVVLTYKVEAIPSNFIIGPDGSIVAKNLEGEDLQVFLNTTFSKAE